MIMSAANPQTEVFVSSSLFPKLVSISLGRSRGMVQAVKKELALGNSRSVALSRVADHTATKRAAPRGIGGEDRARARSAVG